MRTAMRSAFAPLAASLAALALAGAAPAEEPPADSEEAEAPAEASGEPATVSEGRTVSIEYTLTLEDGTEAQSNVGGEPLTFEHGKQQILPALEEELEGMEVDDTVTVTLPPEKGYGERNPDAFQPMEASQIPEEARKEGAMLVMQTPQGQQRPVRVHEVKEEEVVLDLNHPLAGKTLTFDVKVVDIE